MIWHPAAFLFASSGVQGGTSEGDMHADLSRAGRGLPLPDSTNSWRSEKHRDLPQFDDLSPDLIDDILTNAGKFCEEVLQPINQSGDEEGCHFENGVVRTPKGFKEAYQGL